MAKKRTSQNSSRRRTKPPQRPRAPQPASGAAKPPVFELDQLARTTIAAPLLQSIDQQGLDAWQQVIIDLNLDYAGAAPDPEPGLEPRTGRDAAKAQVHALLAQLAERTRAAQLSKVQLKKARLTRQYVFATLTGRGVLDLVRADIDQAAKVRSSKSRADAAAGSLRAVHRIWPDFAVKPHTNRSIATVKADAAHRSFAALGDDIVWAVVDSGIDGKHAHFARHANLKLDKLLQHQDFTSSDDAGALVDGFGHGTHVAGILAGESTGPVMVATRRRSDGDEGFVTETNEIPHIQGMAPKAKLVSLKVLDDDGRGAVSNIIAALAWIQETNAHGRRIQVHGVNLSVGYSFDAEWFACGQSPLCVEVDRLVKSGVCVVVAAGNTGYGDVETLARGNLKMPLALSINDPGNAELAITVGSTHRDMPHVYGVSYFSSKGPTGDGRPKPDLVAPGEKVVSCAAGSKLSAMREQAKGRKRPRIDYLEDSGTSMAAPHVSGVIAAFLSVRREFIGRAEEVKRIFLDSATDLKRERYFQGHGLVDLMRAIQSV